MQIALKTVHGHFVTATHQDENWVLRGPFDHVQPWEVFELIRLDGLRFALKTAHGRYAIATHADENWVIRGHGDTWVGWGVFEMVPVGNQVAIRTVHGHYIGATHGDENWVLRNPGPGPGVTPWDVLTIYEVYDNTTYRSILNLNQNQPRTENAALAELQRRLQSQLDDSVTFQWEGNTERVVVRRDAAEPTAGFLDVIDRTINRILEKVRQSFDAAVFDNQQEIERAKQRAAADAAAKQEAERMAAEAQQRAERVAQSRQGIDENDRRNMDFERAERFSRTA
jgi:hypothetical protein